ncbi:hypothetical protein QQ045_027691 [Rhodiola kirilowii]
MSSKKMKKSTSPAEYSETELIFSYTSNPFGFVVRRKSNNDVVFNTTVEASDAFNNLIFKDQYLEISTRLPKSVSL